MKGRAAVATFVLVMALSASAQTPSPLWTLDLSTLKAYKSAKVITPISSSGFSVAFVDNDTLLVEAEFQSDPDWKANPSVDPPVSNEVIFAIDAKNGTEENSQVWKGWRGLPAAPWGQTFHPTGTSECLVNIGDQLVKLSSDLQVVARRQLALNRIEFNGHPQQDRWSILTDPQSKQALLVHSPFSPDGPATQDGHWISLETLEDKSSVALPSWRTGNVATLIVKTIVFTGQVPAKDFVMTLADGKSPRPLCSECKGIVSGSFGNGLIFLRIHNSYLIVSADGQIHYRGRPVGGRADTIDQVSGAITRNRVAFQFGHLGRTLEETEVVLDVDAKKEIMRFKVNQEPEKDSLGRFIEERFVSPALALSPDGRKLAFLTGTVLSLLEVP